MSVGQILNKFTGSEMEFQFSTCDHITTENFVFQTFSSSCVPNFPCLSFQACIGNSYKFNRNHQLGHIQPYISTLSFKRYLRHFLLSCIVPSRETNVCKIDGKLRLLICITVLYQKLEGYTHMLKEKYSNKKSQIALYAE